MVSEYGWLAGTRRTRPRRNLRDGALAAPHTTIVAHLQKAIIPATEANLDIFGATDA
jgi:hypothetical protein